MKAKRAATTVQRRARSNAARKQTAARWAALRYVQRWTHGNHARLVVRGLFAAARAPARRVASSALKKHPELLLVRAPERGSRQTIVHAVAEGGSVVLLQEVVKKVAEATLGRIASLHEATVLCLQDPRLLDVRRASPLHAAAAAGQLDSVQWLLAKAQNQSFDGRSYTDLPVLKELGLADADGRTPLHAALYAAGAADARPSSDAPASRAGCCNTRRRAENRSNSLRRRAPPPPPPSLTSATMAWRKSLDLDVERTVPSSLRSVWAEAQLIDGVLKASRRAAAAAAPLPPSLPVVAVLKQAIGATSAEAAARCRERLHDATPRLQSAASVANAYDEQQLEEASIGHARRLADISQTLVAASATLQNQYELAGHLLLHRLAEVGVNARAAAPRRAPACSCGSRTSIWRSPECATSAAAAPSRATTRPRCKWCTNARAKAGWAPGFVRVDLPSTATASSFRPGATPRTLGRNRRHRRRSPSPNRPTSGTCHQREAPSNGTNARSCRRHVDQIDP